MSNSALVNYVKRSPHYSKRTHIIDTVTIHCAACPASVEGLGRTFSGSRECSANYGIGQDGRVGMYVDENRCSWCSSNQDNDNRAITIEVACDRAHPYAVAPVVYAKLIDLVTDICKRNGIRELRWHNDPKLVGQVDKQNMTLHRWFAAKACPGDWLVAHHPDIVRQVNARLGSGKLYRVQVGAFRNYEYAQAMLAKLKAAGYPAYIKED